MANEQDLPNDPLGLDAVDRDIRISKLEEEAAELGVHMTEPEGKCTPEIREQFLEHVIAYEKADFVTHMEQLERAGVVMPSAETLDDAALTAKLWEVIRALAGLGVYLYRTDHLSDRELYEHLWNESLREDGPDFPPGSGWNTHLDMLGACSEEDMFLSRKYYDSEEERQRRAEEWPDDEMPPHEDPPFDRDRHLPKGG